MNFNSKVLLFDLDGTLLRDNKTISARTLQALKACRERGILIGLATSRSEARSKEYIEMIDPEVLILSGGAVVKYKKEYIFIDAFSSEEASKMIHLAKEICGSDCGLTMDTLHEHYSNSEKHLGSIYSKFEDFNEIGLKLCVEVADEEKAEILAKKLEAYDCSRFSGENWYKFTKKTSTKENAIQKLSEASGILTEEMAGFGDDHVDLGMIELCGLGVAMGNSIDPIKQAADIVIGSNEEDGIAEFLENYCLK